MAEEVGDSSTLVGNVSAPIGAAILLVIGEPSSDDHRELILAVITKGFQSWDKDATGIDINQELAEISNKGELGEEGSNGERIIRHRTDHVAIEVLVNPQTPTVQHALKNLLQTETRHKHMIYAGHGFQGSGAWILQDDTFTFGYFAHAFKDSDVENSLKKQDGCTFSIHTFSEGEWSNAHINKLGFSKLLKIQLNPEGVLDNSSGALQFTAYISNFVKTTPVTNILQSSDVVGNIRFSRPTLYIFPGCHGDSALFGISGFNLLINGGYSRKACFWDFTRHLDRIDAILLTHLGTDNLFGISSVLHRKSIQNVHPEIGFMYLNASDKFTHSLENGENLNSKEPQLLINLAEEGSRLVEFSKQLGQTPHPCSRNVTTQHLEPVNLYHKVGHGTLDMYILNPVTDSKELKDFYQQWNKLVSTFGSLQHVPLPNMLSICALLIWKPADPSDSITRIFFPGNAPQHKVIEGLERMKNLSVLKHPKCCENDLSKPATKKTARGAPIKTTARLSTKTETTRKTEVKSREEIRSAKPRTPIAKRDKVTKEDVNKKTAKSTEKTDKQKSSTSSSPSKTSSKSVTPSETPKEVVSPKKEAEQPVVGNLIDVSPIHEPDPVTQPLINHIKENDDLMTQSFHEAYPTPLPALGGDAVGLQSQESPESLPDPDEHIQPQIVEENAKFEENHISPEEEKLPIDKHKMEELGIYDEASSPGTEEKTEPLSPRMTHEDEIHPEALPDPVAYPSFIQEPDLIPESPAEKELSPEKELDVSKEFAKQEPDVVPISQDTTEQPSKLDILSRTEDSQTTLLEEPHENHFKPATVTEKVEPHLEDMTSTAAHSVEEVTEPPLCSVIPEQHLESVEHHDIDEEQDEKMAFEKHEESDLDAEQMLRTPVDDIKELPEHEQDEIAEGQDNIIQMEEKEASFDKEIEPVMDTQLHSSPPSNEELLSSDIKEQDGSFGEQTESDSQHDVLGLSHEMKQHALPEMGAYERATEEFEQREPVTDPSAYVYEKEVDLSDEESEDDVQNQQIYQQQREDEENALDDEEHQEVEDTQRELYEEESEAVSTGNKEDHHPLNKDAANELYEEESETVGTENKEAHHPLNSDAANQEYEEDELQKVADQQQFQEQLPVEQLQRETYNQEVQEHVEADQQQYEEHQSPEQLQKETYSKDPHEYAGSTHADSVHSPDHSSEMVDTQDHFNELRAEGPGQMEYGIEDQMDGIQEEHEFEPPSGSHGHEMYSDEPESVMHSNHDHYSEHPQSDDHEQFLGHPEQYSEQSQIQSHDNLEQYSEQPQSTTYGEHEQCSEQLQISSIPAAFEKDETPNPAELLSQASPEPNTVGSETETADVPQSERDDTDSIDGGTPEEEKDIDEAFASVAEPQAAATNIEPESQQIISSEATQNPFDGVGQQNFNPFECLDQQAIDQTGHQQYSTNMFDSESTEDQEFPQQKTFDPMSEWGQPMGLPSPPPPDSAENKSPTKTKRSPLKNGSKTDPKKPEPSKSLPSKSKPPEKRPGSLTASKTSNGVLDNKSARRPMSARTETKPHTRPATAPARDVTEPKARTTAKRTSTATGSRSSPAATKAPPLPPMTPFYVDLTYIPNHGNSSYTDVEFFKRIRARFYVLSSLSPDPQVLNSLVEAKQTWEDKEMEVTVIPTYDNDNLRHWMALHKDKLNEHKIDIAPSANRCTIQLQDHETSCSAYRLEF
ncbi:hypothetical protein ScPMuIL_019007 [Solemya velum]